ncbi:MAG: hypothetical protein WBA23_01940 [Tunicatimonas sp.]|uniref:hypothetical protein n=1 Tax=Tunicatimonas sp. TaxID=1940096 RepID=UPI003C79544C
MLNYESIQIYTKVSKTGTIQIPQNPSLFNKEIEVIILRRSEIKEKKMKASEFIEKWTGFLSDVDADQSKLGYLSDTY